MAGDAAYRADGGDGDGLAVRAATVAGVRHRLAGTAGEDCYGWAGGSAGGQWWVAAAVADGVSASAGAGPAAAAAVAAATSAAREAMDASGDDGPDGAAISRDGAAISRGCVDAAALALAHGGEGRGSGGDTTLVMVVVSADGSWGAARVGDSTAFILSGGSWTEVFAHEEGAGDMETTATAALPSPQPQVETAEGRLAPGDALVLMTDGLARPLRDGPETVAPALAEVLAAPPHPLTLAAAADFVRHGCHDDRTALGVWVHGGDGIEGGDSV